MADDDGGWGSLFAAASEIPDSGQAIQTSEHHGNSKGKRSKKKRKRESSTRRDDSEISKEAQEKYQQMIVGRMKPFSSSDSWPAWIKIRCHLYQKNKCKGFRSCEASSPSLSHLSSCQNCGQSALYHSIEVKDNEEAPNNTQEVSSWSLHMFTAIRNIRCCAKIIVLSEDKKKDVSIHYTVPDAHKDLMKCIEKEYSLLSSYMIKLGSQISPDEATLLLSKTNEIQEYMEILRKPFRNKNGKECKNPTSGSHYNGVHLIIACDAVYYRLYYLQLTQTIRSNYSSRFIPHPDHYFGLNYLTQDIGKSHASFLDVINNVDKEIVDMWTGGSDWILSIQKTSDEHDGEKGSSCYNPLAEIWKFRILETCSIFHSTGWSSDFITTEMVYECMSYPPSDRNYESYHETYAPEPLLQWRDSCRDFICNLYAYATLSPLALQKLAAVLKEKDISIIEVGAGTGYIARLMKNAGVDLEGCWDLHPTTTIDTSSSADSKSSSTPLNEYHGSTPSFCDVKQSSSSTTPMIPLMNRSGSSSSSSKFNKALLLCYPPPQSPMAEETLRSYLDCGGKYLIHIGEFKGLTGNSAFENLLLRTMKCTYRFPCLSWGTDASHVTVWRRTKAKNGRGNKTKGHQLLLPCIECGTNESKKQCRLMRSLVYCSQECAVAHSDVRQKLLSFHMIDVENIGKDYLNFKNDQIFQILDLDLKG